MNHRAFTLIEVPAAIGVMLLLAGSVMGFVWRMGDLRERLGSRSEEQRGLAVLIERLEADLLTALAADPRVGSGIVGDQSRLRILSRGVAMGLTNAGEAAALGDLQATEYSFDAATGEISARRWAVQGSASVAPDAEAMVEGVAWLRLRYFSGRDWTGSFDSSTGLPVAVEVGVWMRSRGAAFAEDATDEAAADSPRLPVRQPDRLRIITVPDGPVAAWKGGAS